MFVADLKRIHNLCDRFHALGLCLWQTKDHSKIFWQILRIKIMFLADLKLIHDFCGRFHALQICFWQI